MIAGDYYLQKYNGTNIDEKIFNAQAGFALGFDVLLNPVMLPIASFSGMTPGYIVKYDGVTAVNSMIFESPAGIGIGTSPTCTLHVVNEGDPIAKFETLIGTSSIVYSILVAYDYYGGEIGIVANSGTIQSNLVCLHQDGAIGIGYTTLKVFEPLNSVGMNIVWGNTPSAQFQINEVTTSTTGTSLLIFGGFEDEDGLAINVKTWYGHDALRVSCRGSVSTTTFGCDVSGTQHFIEMWGDLNVHGRIDASGGTSVQWSAAYTHSQLPHAYVPYTGANANVNLGAYSIYSPIMIGGSAQASFLTFKATTYMTTIPTAIAYSFAGGNYGTTVLFSVNHYGGFGLGVAPTTSAILTVKAGTNTNAPLRLTSGPVLSTATAGSFEYDGTALYFSPGAVRYSVSLSNHTHSYEPVLGNPASNGYILSSTTLGVRSWIATHNAVTIGTANGLSLATQVLSLAAASTSVTGALTSIDWNIFNNKVSFPGFGTTHGTAAFGDHTHSNYDNYNQWTFQPETALGAGASYTISSGFYLQLKAGTGMDLSHSIVGSTVTVTLTSSGGFPGFGTTHTTAAYGDHTHSNYDNYNQWTLTAYNGTYVSKSVISGQEITLQTGANVEWDTADFASDGILVMNVVNIPNIVLTGYTYGSTGLIAATDSLKVALSKLQTQMPKTLYYDIADYVNVGSSATDLENYTLLANTLSSDGQRLELHYSGSSAANTTSKTIQFYFGGTSYIVITNSNASSLNWFLRITIIRYSSTYFRLSFDGNWNIAGSGNVIGTGINYAATNVIKLTAQAGASNEIICKIATITHFSS